MNQTKVDYKKSQYELISWPKNAISGSEISFRWDPLYLPGRTGQNVNIAQ